MNVASFGPAVVAIALLSAPESPDRCVPLVPADLAHYLEAAFPDHRLPRGTDQDEYNVNFNLQHGGRGCLGVAKGDFYGDKQGDVALLLSARQRVETLLVVALRRPDRCAVEQVETWDGASSSYYLDTVPSGTYESPFDREGSQRPNELRSIKSATEGLVAGQVESTALYYFRADGRWRFVWMSD